MAPQHLDLDDSVDLVGDVGTWLGTLFTGIGLLAVVAQLRSVISKTYGQQERLLKRQAGDWLPCLDKQVYISDGVIPQAAPAFAGWVQYKYVNAGSATLTQYNAGNSGTSSWSRFFAQCSVWPNELMRDGIPDPPMTDETFHRKWSPVKADLWKGGGKLLYGFSSSEFSSLNIIAGFPPDHIGEPGPGKSMCYPGISYIADRDAFSQSAQFDPYTGRQDVRPKKGRHLHQVPVQGALHLALGMLKIYPKKRNRLWLIFPNPTLSRREESIITIAPENSRDSQSFDYWSSLPKNLQLNRLSLNLEQMTHVTIGAIFNYSTQSEEDCHVESKLMQALSGHSGPLPFRQALLAAYAVDALEPWALLPVAPHHLVLPFQEILSDFVATREQSVEALTMMIRSPTSASLRSFHPTEGWKDERERIEAVERSGNIRTDYFSQSADNCRYYYEHMVAAFADNDISLALVRKTLAAAVAWHVLFPKSLVYDLEDEKEDNGRQTYMRAMISHLHEGSEADLEEKYDISQNLDWALKIYATYLWGWLGDSIETDGDFLGIFRRRVFLG